jgi:hypothetical protein
MKRSLGSRHGCGHDGTPRGRGGSRRACATSGPDLDALEEGWDFPKQCRPDSVCDGVPQTEPSSALDRDTIPDAMPFDATDAGGPAPRPTLVVCPACGHGNGMRFFCCTVCGLRLHGIEARVPAAGVDTPPSRRPLAAQWHAVMGVLLLLLIGAAGGKVVAGEVEPQRRDGLVRGTRVANAPMVCDARARPVEACLAVPAPSP